MNDFAEQPLAKVLYDIYSQKRRMSIERGVMGRPRAQIGEQAEKKAIRERLKNRSLEGWQRQRLHAVLLACDPARTLPEVAAEVGTHRSTLTEWLRVARAQGWKALLKRQPKGKGAGGSGCMVPFVTRPRPLGQGAGHSATWKVTRESLAAFHHRRSRTKEKVSLRE